ncbi:3'-5' exonuclease [Treponema sp. OMZ 803]|uniref:3'-5' exonuclease n=1 Tax=Treponema sp. OMZ 803 TaxID=120682 RepID=UPI00353220BD
MTIHAAKVGVPGGVYRWRRGIIPHARSMENAGDVEERRLFYVAITRARDKLIITSCRTRRRQQRACWVQPLTVLGRIPAELVQYHEPDTEAEERHHVLPR